MTLWTGMCSGVSTLLEWLGFGRRLAAESDFLLGDGFPERRVKSILGRVDRKKLDWDFIATKKVHFEASCENIPNSKAPILSSTFLVWYGLLIYFLQ